MPFSTLSSTFSFILTLHNMYKTYHQETRPKSDPYTPKEAVFRGDKKSTHLLLQTSFSSSNTISAIQHSLPNLVAKGCPQKKLILEFFPNHLNQKCSNSLTIDAPYETDLLCLDKTTNHQSQNLLCISTADSKVIVGRNY